MIKQFSIFKAKDKKSPNSPDYSISLKINDKYATVGGCWIKEMKDGSKYFSCKLSDGYKDMKGFSIIRDEANSTLTEEEKAKIVALRTGDIVKKAVAEINADSIPF